MKVEAIRIDFAPGARSRAQGGRLLLAAGVLVLGATLVAAVRLGVERDRALASARATEAELQHNSAPVPPAKPDARQAALVRTSAQVAASLDTPWSGLLGSLGATARKDVALLGVEPSAAKRSVRLTAEARDDAEMLAYLAALQHDPRLSSAVLTSHQLQSQAPGAPVRFQIQAQWGATP